MSSRSKSDLPIVIARDVYVDDLTSELPILRIGGHGSHPDYAVRLAPSADGAEQGGWR